MTRPTDSLELVQDEEMLRLQRKRARDRRSQRQARQITKTRLAFMESLVKDMTDQDTSGSTANLLQELGKVTEQRDQLAKALEDITKITALSRVLLPSEATRGAEAPTETAQEIYNTRTISRSDWLFEEDNLSNLNPLLGDGDESMFLQFSAEQSMPEELHIPDFANLRSPGMEQRDNEIFVPDSVFADPQNEPDIDFLQAEPLADSSTLTFDPIVPPPKTLCECNTIQVVPENDDWPRRSLWRISNEALLKTFELGPSIDHMDSDEMSDDIPVRAMLEGWDAVVKHWGIDQLPPAWQILRCVDETLFARDSGKVERLAILRILYLRLAFLRDPTLTRLAKLPPWYHRRPSQDIPHSCAIDFIAWPGIRERFIFQQHRYCSNSYWKTFAVNMRILWPYAFRDCYMSTGKRYCISPSFDGRVSDIKCWAMGPDLFSQYPEFYCDIPAFSQTPRDVSITEQLKLAYTPYYRGTTQSVLGGADAEADQTSQNRDTQPTYANVACFTNSDHDKLASSDECMVFVDPMAAHESSNRPLEGFGSRLV